MLTPVADFRAAASMLMERIRFARRVGLTTHAGKRDVSGTLGYNDTIAPEDYRTRYERNEVAATVVDAMAKATWRGSGELVEDENPDNVTDFEEAWFTLSDRLGTWSRLQRADILAGLGRFSIVVIGAPGPLNTELPNMRGPEDVAYLSLYGETDVTIDDKDLVTDTADPRYAKPMFYQVGRIATKAGWEKRAVHWTRIVHVADGLLDDDLFAQPRMQRVWNRLDDLEKVVGGGSEAFWLLANQGMQLDMDKDVAAALQTLPDQGQAAKKELSEQIDEYQNNVRRVLRTSGVNLQMLGSNPVAFHNQVDALIMLISAGSRIPKRIFSGSEMGELASSQDKDNWDERVSDRRESFAGPYVVRQLVDRLIKYRALPEPRDGYMVRWPEIENMDEDQRASIALKYAQANNYNGDTIVTANEIRDRVLGFPPIEEVLDEADLAAQDAADAAAAGLPRAAARYRLRAAKLHLRADRIRAITKLRGSAKKKYPARTLSIAPQTGILEGRNAS